MTGRRVLVVSQLPPPFHGSTVMTRALLDALEHSAIPVSICDRRYSRSVDEIGQVSARKMFASLGFLWRILVEVVRRRPAVVVVFLTNRPASFLSDLAAVAAVRLFRIDVVHYVHTVGFRSLAARGGVWTRLVAATLRAADVVVGLGDSLFDDVGTWVPAARYRVIQNIAVDPPGTIASAPRDRVLFFSNLIPDKGVLTFVQMASRIGSAVHDVDFVLVGAPGDDDHMREIRNAIDNSGLPDRISYVGVAHGDDKWRQICAARVHVFPSTYRFEAQPLSVIESLYAGTPVVAYDVGGLRDLDWCALLTLVPAGDLDGLCDAVLEAVRGTQVRPDAAASRDIRAALGHERFEREWGFLLSTYCRAG